MIGMTGSGVTRGVLVGCVVALAMSIFVPWHISHPFFVLYHGLAPFIFRYSRVIWLQADWLLDPVDPDDRGKRHYTGMSGVVPAWHLLDFLNSEPLKMQRRADQQEHVDEMRDCGTTPTTD